MKSERKKLSLFIFVKHINTLIPCFIAEAQNWPLDFDLEITPVYNGLLLKGKSSYLSDNGLEKICFAPQEGRGSLLKRLWAASKADFVGYISQDILLNQETIRQVVPWLLDGYDLIVGHRLAAERLMQAGRLRERLSKGYNLLARSIFDKNTLADIQCHFKFLKKSIFLDLAGVIQSNRSFFDTELMVYAQEHGLRIKEIPVSCCETKENLIDIFRFAQEDLSGLLRLKRALSEQRLVIRKG